MDPSTAEDLGDRNSCQSYHGLVALVSPGTIPSHLLPYDQPTWVCPNLRPVPEGPTVPLRGVSHQPLPSWADPEKTDPRVVEDRGIGPDFLLEAEQLKKLARPQRPKFQGHLPAPTVSPGVCQPTSAAPAAHGSHPLLGVRVISHLWLLDWDMA